MLPRARDADAHASGLLELSRRLLRADPHGELGQAEVAVAVLDTSTTTDSSVDSSSKPDASADAPVDANPNVAFAGLSDSRC
jgi:hypothetical protein